MTLPRGTAQIHLIGEIKTARGFDGNRLFCKYSVRCGHQWTLFGGKSEGETYEEVKDETEDAAQWDHPFDLYYKAEGIRGWPRFFLEVWTADNEGRYSLGGYGVGVVPFSSGQKTMMIECWRPKPQGFFKRIAASILGIQPELNFKDMAMSSAERFGQEVESTGSVEIEIGVIHKDFGIHGVKLQDKQGLEYRVDALN